MTNSLLWLSGAIVLVLANGFFVAAEFALVKLRPSRLAAMVREGRPFAPTAAWLARRLNNSLSACQLGITMASLGLGWVGEPAIARLLEPLFASLGIEAAAVVHTVSFLVAFMVITAAHLVIGEQAPKIFAIREPERMTLWCALPLKAFYILTYPLLVLLSASTNMLLRRVGVSGDDEHDAPHSEEELRLLLSSSHSSGEITRSEHRLIDAVFEFDDTICRKIMRPRVDVAFFDAEMPLTELLAISQRGRHTRYPVCEGSIDHVIGVMHIKDLIGLDPDQPFDIRAIMRPPRYVPETMSISKLLGHFQATHQHLAFVVDEHGTTAGLVTLEDVLERIVGDVEDEFDDDIPDIVPSGSGQFIVKGSASLEAVNRALDTRLASEEMDTIGGLLMETLGRVVEPGDRVALDGIDAEVLEVQRARAVRLRLSLPRPEPVESAGTNGS